VQKLLRANIEANSHGCKARKGTIKIEPADLLTNPGKASKMKDKYDVLLASEFLFSAGDMHSAFRNLIEPLKPGGVLLIATSKYPGIVDVLKNLETNGYIVSLLDIELLTSCSVAVQHRCRSDNVLVVFRKPFDDTVKWPGKYDEPLPESLMEMKDQRSNPPHNIPDLIPRLWRLATISKDPQQGARAPRPYNKHTSTWNQRETKGVNATNDQVTRKEVESVIKGIKELL